MKDHLGARIKVPINNSCVARSRNLRFLFSHKARNALLLLAYGRKQMSAERQDTSPSVVVFPHECTPWHQWADRWMPWSQGGLLLGNQVLLLSKLRARGLAH
eukprot:873337-Pelagomonas_calceolata.AAC.5